MGFFDAVISDFRKKRDDLVSSRFNVVNQARSAIALSRPVIRQGVQRVKSTPAREFFLPTSRVGYTGLQNLPAANFAPQIKSIRDVNPYNVGANIAQGFVNTPIRSAQAIGRIGQDYAQNTTTAPRLIGNVATIAETPLTFATFGTGAVAKPLIRLGAKGAIKQAIKQGAISGAKVGGTFGLLQGLGENRESKNVFEQFLRSVPQVAGGAVAGGVLGGAISGGSALKSKLFNKTPQVEQQLRDRAGKWVAGQTPVKPKGMTQESWNFQIRFNKAKGRNPYTPVYASDLTDEASKKIGFQVRDINKDKAAQGRLYDVNAKKTTALENPDLEGAFRKLNQYYPARGGGTAAAMDPRNLAPNEFGALKKHLMGLKDPENQKLRGAIVKSYGGAKDLVFGVVKDRTYKGQKEYLVMDVSNLSGMEHLKGKFRLHSTPISEKQIINKVDLNSFTGNVDDLVPKLPAPSVAQPPLSGALPVKKVENLPQNLEIPTPVGSKIPSPSGLQGNQISSQIPPSSKGLPLQKPPKGELAQKLAQERNLTPQTQPATGTSSGGIPGGSSPTSISQGVNPTDPYFNVERLNISPEAKKAVAQVVEESKAKIEAITGGKLSNKEVIDFANNTARVLNKTIPVEQTKAWEAAMLKTRQTLAAQAQDGKVTKEFLDNLLTVKTQSTDIARKLQSLGIGADPQTVSAKQAILQAVLDAGKNADDILRAAEGVDFNDINQATQFYRKFIAPKASEWIDLLRYNSMLSSPNTHIVNTASNVQGASLVAPLEKATLGGLDFLSSVVTGKQRQYYAGESGAYLKGFVSSLKQASHNFADVMSGKALNQNPDIRNIPLATKGFKRGIENVLSIPLKFLEAEDQFVQTLARAGETRALQFRQAKGVPVKNLELQASLKGAQRLFRGELSPEGQGHILNAIDSVTGILFQLRSHNNPVVSTIAKFTIPFIKTPMNILKQGIEYSPAGLSTLPGAASKMEQLNKALLGSAIGMGTAILLGSNRLTWAKPTDARGKKAFDEAGMQPYSFKVGDKWISYSKLHPAIAFNFAIVAGVKDAVDSRRISDSDGEVILEGLAKSLQFFADQSYVKNIGDFIASTKGDVEGITRYIANYPSQLIPFRALGSWVNRITDPYERQVDPAGDQLTKQMQYIASQIPGLSQQLPVKRGTEGQPLKREGRLMNAFSPTRITTEKFQEKRNFLYGTNANRTYNELRKLPKDEANTILKKLKVKDKALYNGVITILRDERLGLTDTDARIRKLTVKDGTRARTIADQLKKLKTPEEKNAYIKKLRDAKIITDEVLKQLKELKKRGEL